jgi:hypothetical protein
MQKRSKQTEQKTARNRDWIPRLGEHEVYGNVRFGQREVRATEAYDDPMFRIRVSL